LTCSLQKKNPPANGKQTLVPEEMPPNPADQWEARKKNPKEVANFIKPT
jgi:hypothetical protein